MRLLPLPILPQPNDETCGPTCLHAVYRYWGDGIQLPDIIDSARSLNTQDVGRGTLAVMLGMHALKRGYQARLYTYNLQVFDPTWFGDDGTPCVDLSKKLNAQADAKADNGPRFQAATDAYLTFLNRGGQILFQDLTSELIAGFIDDGLPVLTGVSATYLYRCAREYGPRDDYDDVRGVCSGHFIVVHGYDNDQRTVAVADPLADNPGFEQQRYWVPMHRLVPAIMLGVLTHDANLLVIEPVQRSCHTPASGVCG